jgi:hypothetical protein
MEELSGIRVVHFSPQSMDMDVDEIGNIIKLVIPNVLSNSVAGNRLIGMAHEEF